MNLRLVGSSIHGVNTASTRPDGRTSSKVRGPNGRCGTAFAFADAFAFARARRFGTGNTGFPGLAGLVGAGAATAGADGDDAIA